MGFKKHNWITYGKSKEILEITVKGDMGGKIDSFKCNNNKDYRRILKILRDKYGFDFKQKSETKKELKLEEDWMDRDVDF